MKWIEIVFSISAAITRRWRRKRLALLFVLCLTPLFIADAQSRCGVERWHVKTGTDPTAASIDLTSVSPTTLQNLVQIPAPDVIPPEDRVSGPETTVWQINA